MYYHGHRYDPDWYDYYGPPRRSRYRHYRRHHYYDCPDPWGRNYYGYCY